VIEILPNRITQLKTEETDGYNAIQVTTRTKKASKLTKPLIGHYAKANVEPGIGLWEFRVDGFNNAETEYKVGSELTLELFNSTSLVDVIGTSKGKGFAGVIKRHHFSMQDATHGNSLSHRVPGSIGQRQSPGKVFKGKKMAGQMGNKRITMQSLELVKLDLEKNLLLLSGSVPGAPGSQVIVFPAKKERSSKPSQPKKDKKEGSK
jgi:large subunit ribosomal protein L3